MRRNTTRRAAALLSVMGMLAACGGESGSSNGGTASGGGGDAGDAAAESCYEGETARFVVPFPPGGGYDTIARAIAPYLKEELGASAVVVANEPGAGGLVATNNLYLAEPDGLTFALLAAQGVVGSSLADASGAQYDLDKFTYVARLADDVRVLLASPQSGIKSLEDLKGADKAQYATAGTGAADHIDANVLPTILGIEDQVQVVSGFEGDTQLAVTTGEVELGSGTLGRRMNGIQTGDEVPILLMARERDDAVPDVPALLELDLDNPELAEAYVGLQEVGRSVFAPPNMEENCLAQLQDGLRATLENEDFKAQVGEKLDEPLEYTDGEELRQIVQDLLEAPEELVELLKTAYANQ